MSTSTTRVADDLPTVPDEVAWWDRLRTGDSLAMTWVFNQHVDAVHRFAFRRLALRGLAEDATQQTFTAV